MTRWMLGCSESKLRSAGKCGKYKAIVNSTPAVLHCSCCCTHMGSKDWQAQRSLQIFRPRTLTWQAGRSLQADMPCTSWVVQSKGFCSSSLPLHSFVRVVAFVRWVVGRYHLQNLGSPLLHLPWETLAQDAERYRHCGGSAG